MKTTPDTRTPQNPARELDTQADDDLDPMVEELGGGNRDEPTQGWTDEEIESTSRDTLTEDSVELDSELEGEISVGGVLEVDPDAPVDDALEDVTADGTVNNPNNPTAPDAPDSPQKPNRL